MSAKNVFQVMSPVAVAVLLAACGADSINTDASPKTEPTTAAANEVTGSAGSSSEGGSDTSTSISGRVADGYIQGATVCVDLNNSDSCDADEPSALTGIGGSYDLTVPAGAQDKPIVADIPAEAIDEDTGAPIGKPLVFIAPADQPEFISPITTLVHQEQQNNPSLDIEEAEQSVKNLLGVSEEDVSLFDDYVAGGRDETGTEDDQSNFRYLHDTARVVTSMMKEIESEVELAAESDGIDVVGSEDTQRAIRDIVRRQVKELLPAIAFQVASLISSEESAATDESSEAEGTEEFDPEKIALALKPDDVEKDVQAQIDAVIERVDPVKADIRQLLTDGVYTLEFDCYYDDYLSESEYVFEPEYVGEPVDIGIPFDDELSYDCEPFYSKVQLDAASDELGTRDYALDTTLGTWVEIVEEDEEYSEYILVDGQWQEFKDSDSGPQGKVEFTAEGSVIVRETEGVMEFKAATQSLDAVSVKSHLLSEDADSALLDLVQSTDVFPSGSLIHTVSVKETLNPYVLFNERPYDDEIGEANCAEYFDNCNVMGNMSGDQFVALRSLTDVQKGAEKGIQLESLQSIAYGAIMTLAIDGESDGTVPVSGSVTWSFGYSNYAQTPAGPAIDYIDPASGASYLADPTGAAECYAPGGIEVEFFPGTSVPVDIPEGFTEAELTNNAPVPGGERPADVPYYEEPFPFPEYDKCIDPAAQTGGFGDKPVVSRWKIVEVDGVKLIEIQLPDEMRYDEESMEQALILAEHDGFVRQGERLSVVSIDRVATYNETAFATLRAIVEKQANRD